MSLSNFEVAKKFAQRTIPKVRKDSYGYEGRTGFHNSRGNVFTDTHNTEIYSYGTHFTMAIAYDDKKLFLINGDTYSHTTSRHQSEVRGAIQNHGPSDWKSIILPFSALNAAGINFDSIEPIEVYFDREVAICKTCGWQPTGYYKYGDLLEHKDSNEDHETYYSHRLGEALFSAEVSRMLESNNNTWRRGFTGWRNPKQILKKRVYFLSGFDDTANHRGGYFISALPKKVSTVDEAYEALKPKEVVEAESKGIKVLRQGDIFAIPTEYTTAELRQFKHTYTKAKREEYPSHKRIFLDWRNREKYAEEYADQIAEHSWYIEKEYWRVERPGVLGTDHTVGEMLILTGKKPETYARGSIRHNHNDNPPSPEHRVVYLAKGIWYRMVRNTSLGDWTAQGNVD